MNCSNSRCKNPKGTPLTFTCEYCKEHSYCSEGCKLEDWRMGHCSICLKHQVKVLNEHMFQYPFFKEGKFLTETEAIEMAPKIKDVNAHYEKIKSGSKLGKGAYGEVVLMKEKSNNRLVAMKVVEKANLTTQKGLEALLNEIKLLQRTLHDNIIRR